ncbi:hypothetical protein LSCM1_03144 [Leishmania martiniquensis]|uniref:Uncharacterized protein n=1 Tax=Leishmania martiniquensis TaxID=1580590 RepID=A0A836KFJ6_9TRYP|nr:hypothetical protein LSCM1_03144 [Leishmania martiniquensis]
MSEAASAPVGKWVIVRSDRLVVSVDKADHAYVMGRGRQLPPAQLLSHKYASREQLELIWHPPYLCMIQRGKNPSFLGAECTPVPPLRGDTAAQSGEGALPPWQHAQVRFTATSAVEEATAYQSVDGIFSVNVPFSDPLTVTQAPDRHSISAATVHFPEEIGLPTLTVRFEATAVKREDSTAAATTKTAAEMLAVPSAKVLGAGDDDDEELSDSERRAGGCLRGAAGSSEGAAAADGSEKPGWRGLLDVALQQEQQQGAAAKALAAQAKEARSSPPRIPADPAPHKIGLWEWKKRAQGEDSDSMSWGKYNLAVAQLLENAYQDASITTVKIPDCAMFGKPGAKGYTYGVCFAEKALDGAMIQYSLDEPSKYCAIRRTGGPPVNRKRAKSAHVIPSPSSSEEDESESEENDDEDSDSEESLSSSSSSSRSSSDGAPQKKRRLRH